MVSIVRTTPLTCGCQASVTMRIFADMSVYLFLRVTSLLRWAIAQASYVLSLLGVACSKAE